MTDPTAAARRGWLAAGGAASALWVCALSGSSCIIPDHGIVALVDCGSRWCSTAEFAQALNDNNNIVQVQTPHPDGSSGWVTGCVCMTPAEDLVLLAGDPPIQYELLRNQVIDAARQACLDAAIANGFDPDPPWPLDDLLEPSCYEAPATIFRDGCCKRLNSECGTSATCDADPDPTDGEAPATDSATTTDSPDPTASPDSSTGEMSSLAPFYAEITCDDDACRIGQPLVDAILADPELLLAEGTSLRFASTSAGRPLGLVLQGVEPDTLAGHLGLRDHDVLLRVDDLPLRNEAELLEAATHAQDAERLTVVLLRSGETHERVIVRER